MSDKIHLKYCVPFLFDMRRKINLSTIVHSLSKIILFLDLPGDMGGWGVGAHHPGPGQWGGNVWGGGMWGAGHPQALGRGQFMGGPPMRGQWPGGPPRPGWPVGRGGGPPMMRGGPMMMGGPAPLMGGPPMAVGGPPMGMSGPPMGGMMGAPQGMPGAALPNPGIYICRSNYIFMYFSFDIIIY